MHLPFLFRLGKVMSLESGHQHPTVQPEHRQCRAKAPSCNSAPAFPSRGSAGKASCASPLFWLDCACSGGRELRGLGGSNLVVVAKGWH